MIGYIAQPIVLAMETVIITRPIRRVVEVVVVETVAANGTAMVNGTMSALNDTLPAVLGMGQRAALHTAPTQRQPVPLKTHT